ncbi:MAG: T9SS type A sorting domain-containing protein [Bacteroidetes bacterium]|nr:T9SS type A sorting domain-containing protein [Bacteroidota bacterium]
MKNIYTFFLAALFSFALNAQQYLNQNGLNNRNAQKPANFYDVQRAFNSYWENKTPSDTESENAEDDGYQQFKRWESFAEQRTFPSGNFPSPEILFQQYQAYKNQYPHSNMNVASANWSFFGPNVIPGNGGGAGRINCIAFDPANSNIIWIGAACGGLWKSTDGGVTWFSNTDLLPALSISDIVIDPSNPQTMYIATGDKYGIYYQYEVWGHYSAGVLKSTDGGLSWNTTGLNYALMNLTLIQRLIIDPSNASILYAATNQGIFKTTDAAVTWSSIRSGKFYDMEMKPGTSGTLYAGDSTGVIVSTNSGGTWNYVPTVTSTGRTSIAVTPANVNVVYVWSEGGGFYYSNNSATSFIVRTDPSSSCTPYGYYDMVLEVSPTNENILATGGLSVAKTTNGGVAWTTTSDYNWPNTNYVHADNHALKFLPGSATNFFSCNDGGIFKTTDQGNTWSDLSGGIAIKQYYRIGGSALTPSLIYGGAQDNGTDQVTGVSTANHVYGADGEECLVDYSDDNIVFVSYQNGAFQRSTDGGASFSPTSAFGCDWTSPLIMDPSNHDIMYMGSTDVLQSTDNGVTWNNISNGAFDGGCLYSLEICQNNPQCIYAATFGHIYRTTNGGVTWTNITGTLPVGSAAISGITIKDSDPNSAWVTFSGFSAPDKVYYTNDGGASWSNVSGTLPNIPANCIEYQNGSNDLLYLGTDLGVFYMDATMNDWLPYNNGMPNVIIDELEINYGVSKLRAATYGRGIWESDLQVSSLVNLDASAFGMSYPPTTTCDTAIAPVIRIRNAGVDTIFNAELHYKMDAQSWQVYNWSGTLASLAIANITLPVFNLTAGAHTLVAYTANPNLLADMNNNNDTITRSFTILSNAVGATPPPVVEGFVNNIFPPANWQLENSSALWSRSVACGGYTANGQSAMADFYNISSGTDVLATPFIDLTNSVAPITLYFDVAYAPYDPTYLDSMFIDLYSDCGGTETVLYKKGYLSLATAPAQATPFVPAPAQWRTDTLHLDSLAGHSPMRIRFIAKSGYGNQLYIDNINISGNAVGISPQNSTSEFSVYPNPADNAVNIEWSSGRGGEILFVMYDVTGKEILRKQENASPGINRFTINTSDLPSGIYLLRANENGILHTQRISVAK